MSLDLGVLIIKNRKKINLFEVNLSSDQKRLIKSFKKPEELLAFLEENNIGYEGFAIKGFAKKN